jgi:hypothetical protein
MDRSNRFGAAALLLAGALFALPACNGGSHAREERTVTHTYEVDDYGNATAVEVESYAVESDADDDCDGALSCTADFVGDVIALPFRAVAGIVDFVF